MSDNPELQAHAQTGSPENLFVPAICLYDVFKHVLQGLGEEGARDALGIVSPDRSLISIAN